MAKAKTTLSIGSAGTFRNSLNAMLSECYGSIVKKRSGAWYLCGHSCQATSAVASAAQASCIRFAPFTISETVTLDKISWFVSAAGTTGAITQAAIYSASSSTNLPTGDPLASTSGISSTTTNSRKEAAISVTLTPGLYWAALGCNDSSLTYSAAPSQGWVYYIMGMPGAGNPWVGASSGGAQCVSLYYPTTVTDGVWPTFDGQRSTFTSSNTGSITPNIMIRTV